MDFDYKKHSLERLEEWMNDTLLSSEASSQEIYDVIKKATEENYHYFKHHTERCYELLALLNGNGKGHIQAYDEYAREWETDKTVVAGKEENTAFFNVDTAGNMTPSYISPVTCDKDDQSPECKGAWNNFWDSEEVSDDCMPPWGHSDMEALSRPDWHRKIMPSATQSDVDKVKKWVLPVEELGEMQFITFPDDLLEAANLKEGDQIEWVDKGDGSFLLKKSWSDPYRDKMLAAGYKMVDGVWTLKKVPQTYDEMITAGYTMTDDGFWIKEN
jgi:hypothetical protein